MSGLCTGQSITVTFSLEKKILIDFALWNGALSCINTAGWLTAVLKLGKKCCYNNSLYTNALIRPCNLTRAPGPAANIKPNTITLPPPNFTLQSNPVNCISDNCIIYFIALKSQIPNHSQSFAKKIFQIIA